MRIVIGDCNIIRNDGVAGSFPAAGMSLMETSRGSHGEGMCAYAQLHCRFGATVDHIRDGTAQWDAMRAILKAAEALL
jgi:hypothetical protein